MLLRKIDRDLSFKRGFIGFISSDSIQFEDLRRYVSQFTEYTKIGRAYRLFGKRKDVEAKQLADLDRNSCWGSDQELLLFLGVILELKQNMKEGKIERNALSLGLRTQFRFALDCLNSAISDPALKRELARMEVEDSSAMATAYQRIGEFGWNRLVDYMLSESDTDRLFALEQFEYLHSHDNRTYDSAYPAIKVALKKAKQDLVRRKLLKLQRDIEKTNPSAVIPSVVQEIVAKVRSKSSPVDILTFEIRKWKLDYRNACILGLNAASRLLEMNDVSAARQLLGEAARYAGNDRMLLACIAQELGDNVKAARLLLEETESQVGQFAEIRRFYTTEAAGRLLFQTDSSFWTKELRSAVSRFEALNFNDVVAKLREWLAYENGFESYLQKVLEDAKAVPFDPYELRISQRSKSISFFLSGVVEDFRRNFKAGQRWFELSAKGNDAPWIHGSRAFFNAIDLSLKSLKLGKGSQKGKQLVIQTRKNFEKAAKYLRSQDPIAISISFLALTNSRHSINGKVIGDLTFAIEMLKPRTPEVLEMKQRLSKMRWKLIEIATKSSSVDRRTCAELWEQVVRLSPLLDEVIDNDQRLRDSLFPFLQIERLEPLQTTVEGLLSVDDTNTRGKLLEDLMADIIAQSPGLKLVDIRHSNDYEEIDIVVLVTRGSPILEQWGPLIFFECKNWQQKVGTIPVGYLYSKMATKKNAIKLGILVSPSGFTKGVSEQIARFPNALILTFGPIELRDLVFGKKDIRTIIEERIPLTLLS